jgi:hypothetical protein
MKSNWLSFAVSDSRQYSYINVTLGAAGISPAFEMRINFGRLCNQNISFEP